MDRIKIEITGGNAAEGLRRAEILVARRPEDDAATLLLAQAQRDTGDLAASLGSLKRVQSRNPSGETAALIFNVSRELGTDEGFGELERWTTSHRDARALQAMLAEGYLGAGRNREAIAAFEKMIAADPKSVFALNNLAWVYHLEKDARAVPTARRAFELAPRAPQIADTYGWLLLERGDHAEALRILQETDAAAPLLDPESRYHLAAALARNGKREEAAHQLSQLLEEAGAFPARPAAEALAASLK
jgi:Tfp pilus assembly protein PilF